MDERCYFCNRRLTEAIAVPIEAGSKKNKIGDCCKSCAYKLK